MHKSPPPEIARTVIINIPNTCDATSAAEDIAAQLRHQLEGVLDGEHSNPTKNAELLLAAVAQIADIHGHTVLHFEQDDDVLENLGEVLDLSALDDDTAVALHNACAEDIQLRLDDDESSVTYDDLLPIDWALYDDSTQDDEDEDDSKERRREAADPEALVEYLADLKTALIKKQHQVYKTDNVELFTDAECVAILGAAAKGF